MDFGILFLAQIISLIIWLVIIVYCVNKARDLNRDKFGWGLFAFLLPIIALIWIQFVDPIEDEPIKETIIRKPEVIINVQKEKTVENNPLETLKDLKVKGIITNEEYEEKEKVISEQLRKQRVDDELRNWYQVVKSRIDKKSQPLIALALKAKQDGVISEQEFEIKEKEILAKCSDEILKQDINFNKSAYNNLTKPKQDKVELYLDTLVESESIVLVHNKIKVIDSQRLKELLKDGAPESFQIIYQNKNAT